MRRIQHEHLNIQNTKHVKKKFEPFSSTSHVDTFLFCEYLEFKSHVYWLPIYILDSKSIVNSFPAFFYSLS